MSENPCGDCKRCCEESLVRVREEDLKRWKEEQRYDIILCVETWIGANAYLIHKKTGGCIFLTPKGCEIYETRPQICREYPQSERQAEKFGCQLDPKTHRPRKN